MNELFDKMNATKSIHTGKKHTLSEFNLDQRQHKSPEKFVSPIASVKKPKNGMLTLIKKIK